MNPADLPIIGDLLTRGPEDPLYRGLLFTGPLVVVLITILGRSTVTVGLAVCYIALLLLAVVYNVYQ